MAWSRTGTVTVTNNSNVVTGVGTAWVDAATLGEAFLGPDGQVYEITSIVSATSLRITPNYKGSTASGQSYAIIPTQGYMRDLAIAAAALVEGFNAVKNNAGAGKFAAGTAAAPSVRGVGDENTGVNFPGADVLELVTGGVARLLIGASGVPSGSVAEHLVNRANHTGKQAIGTVDGLDTALASKQTPAGALAQIQSYGVGAGQAPTLADFATWPTLPTSFWRATTAAVNAPAVGVGMSISYGAGAGGAAIFFNRAGSGPRAWVATSVANTSEGPVELARGRYDVTTASGANAFITSTNEIQRSSSSAKYKKEIEPADAALMQAVIDEARPVWYRSNCEADPSEFSYWGLIAEELADTDPRFVHWARPLKTVQRQEQVAVQVDTGELDAQGQPIFRIETRTETFTEEIPDVDAPLQAEGVMYERLVVPLLWHAKQQQARLDAMEKRLAAMEGAA